MVVTTSLLFYPTTLLLIAGISMVYTINNAKITILRLLHIAGICRVVSVAAEVDDSVIPAYSRNLLG